MIEKIKKNKKILILIGLILIIEISGHGIFAFFAIYFLRKKITFLIFRDVLIIYY